jgi:hypothetical protein
MPRAKRSIEATVTIDGFSLFWRLHREQQEFTSDGWKGISIHVRVVEAARRELFLEYPAVAARKVGRIRTEPARPTVIAAKVEGHIREAMAAGWDPDSRGKPFFYQVAELPS